MATACIAQLTFKCSPKTTTVARFDQAQASTDGGGCGRGRGTRVTTRQKGGRTVAERAQTGDVGRESPVQNLRRPPDHTHQRTWGPAAALSDHDRGRAVAGFSSMAATDSLTIGHE